ncbi:tetratricopeptide repeat protein [Marinobacterium sp. AK62]|uniref:Tetratricopeptide repeat protein n=1 Tax=Marinobacterium alkalitolerans TaxID=1542925 RepID=A0ABS3Z7T5_9GAMM|nr:tetratricopeptide repeat protein [Marinobacterium alkalitolerans]MBP0047765.1 tetratricopeptide repeat protein [Marinobacterium alkalitolerans]
MAELRTEEEQLNALKAWWKENGRSLVVGVAAAIAIVVGWQSWQAREQQQAAAASALYQNLAEAVQLAEMQSDDSQYATAKHLAEQLQNDFESTAYARFAALAVAAAAVKQADYEFAQTQLDWVIDSAEANDDLARVASLRKAALLQQLSREQEAIALLKGLDAATFESERQELLGDLLKAEGELAGAYDAYEAALEAGGGEQLRPLLKMKRDDLAGARS